MYGKTLRGRKLKTQNLNNLFTVIEQLIAKKGANVNICQNVIKFILNFV